MPGLPSAVVTLLGAINPSTLEGFQQLLNNFGPGTANGTAVCNAFKGILPATIPLPAPVAAILSSVTAALVIPTPIASVITQVAGALAGLTSSLTPPAQVASITSALAAASPGTGLPKLPSTFVSP